VNPSRDAAEGGSTVGRRPIGEGSRRNEYVPTLVENQKCNRRRGDVPRRLA